MQVVELKNSQSNKVLISKVEIARSFIERGRGLLGRKSLDTQAGLWILHCNSIHTFFMKFAIDCVFLDKNLRVTAVYENVRPWRLIGPLWKARSVIELTSGQARKAGIQVGDQLYVGA